MRRAAPALLAAAAGHPLSMFHDDEAAIEEGATMVRVGTAIFGPRGCR